MWHAMSCTSCCTKRCANMRHALPCPALPCPALPCSALHAAAAAAASCDVCCRLHENRCNASGVMRLLLDPYVPINRTLPLVLGAVFGAPPRLGVPKLGVGVAPMTPQTAGAYLYIVAGCPMHCAHYHMLTVRFFHPNV
jgi:hypothetical protein